MNATRKHKKNLIVSYKNLPDDLKEQFKELYPEGYSNYLQKFTKPNGEPIFVVPLETDDTAYMVKFEVKIDTLGEGDDIDKDIFDDGGKEDEFAPLSEAMEKDEENTSHTERVLKHGSYDDLIENDINARKKAAMDIDKEEIKQAFGDDSEADELDSYERMADDDLRGIEDEFLDAEVPPLDATIPEEAMAKPAQKAAPARKKSK